MSTQPPRRYRAADPIDDLCRVCKQVRRHTVMVADGEGRPARVVCDYCGSQHDYRGGGARTGPASGGAAPPPRAGRDPLPFVSERERSGPPMSLDVPGGSIADFELLLRRVLREEAGVTAAVPADKWRGGEMILKPGREGLQEKSFPIDTLFHKIVMIRNRLRVLEQQVNATDALPDDVKLKLQSYITGCYGSLTSFNVLFADEDDKFKGSE